MEFVQFWEEHKDKYISLAREDFDKLNSKTTHRFTASAYIDEDDDFKLDIGSSFDVYGNTLAEVKLALIEKLNSAEFTYCKTWGITDQNGTKTGDYSGAWYNLRDEIIKQIKEAPEARSFSWGGNQTLEVYISENVPTYEKKKVKP